FGELKVGKWIAENSYKYGFVIRYPADKKDITGISFEPWHIRYVGVEHATAMHEMGMCLEEYADFLRERYPDAETESSPDQYPAPRFAGDTEGAKPASEQYAEAIDRFLAYERGVKQPDEVVFSFVGDCTLGTWPAASADTNYNTLYEKSGSPTYSFDIVKPLFESDDYSYVNLETTLTTSTKMIENKTYNFKGDMAWAKDMIAASGIDGCNLANNHCYDWGEQSYHDTVTAVKESGMDVGDEDNVIVKKINGVEVVLISCNFIHNGNYTYTDGRKKVYGDELITSISAQIKERKREDNIVVVNCHWGIEREQKPEEEQTTAARRFVDEGADLIIGHHPHTLQSVELYNDAYIFYSIGNFAFGGKGTTDEVNRISLMVRPRFALRDGKAQVTGILIVPCYTTSAPDVGINNYQPRPLWGSEAQALLDKTLTLSKDMKYGVTELVFPTVEFEGISE
ncbi:MAG: CapA family protein, partial [Clostridia bacterium]|nr:CapA family protein [Clostridia bacterium]